MKGELVPAVVAGVGGSALLGVVVAREAYGEARMRASRSAHSVTFPLGTEPQPAMRALAALSGLNPNVEIVATVAASGDEIRHILYLPEQIAAATVEQLRTAIPGLRVRSGATSENARTFVKTIVVPQALVLRVDDPVGASRALLAALLPLDHGEQIRLSWALRPGEPPRPTDTDDRAWRVKLAEPGMRAVGQIAVNASNPKRAKALAARLEAVLHARRGAHGRLLIRRSSTSHLPRASRHSGWLTTSEIASLIGWPVGSDPVRGVQLGAARQIPPTRALAREGRPLFIADDSGTPRPVALGVEAAKRHTALLGATGSGKSSVLTRGILADIAAGHGGVVLDPQGDVVSDVLDRVRLRDAGRIVVLDLANPGPLPGVDLFGGGDPDLRADVLLTVLRGIYEGWGPRVEGVLRLGVRSLAEIPGAALSDWPRLFTDAHFRRQVVGQLGDGLLRAEWRMYESLSDGEQAQSLAPGLSRVMSLIGRPVVRAVLGQQNPKLDIAAVLERRGWVLASVPVGVIGAPAARLISSCLTYLVWSAVAARATMPPEKRHPLSLVFDEAQAVADLGIGLEDLLERSRGYGASVTIATQAAGRLPEQMRHALLSNVGTLIAFKSGAAAAAHIARELPGLDARDLLSLGEYEVAARVALGRGAASSVVTGYTDPLPPPLGHAARIRTQSAARYGRDRAEIEKAVQERYSEPTEERGDARVGRARRQI